MNGEQLRFDSNTPSHWRPAVRVDVGRLAKATKIAVGYRVDAVIARAGVLEYVRADGTKVREYLPPEEAGRLDSLATLRDAPVTVSHPGGGTRMVTLETFRTDAVGHVSGEPSFDRTNVHAQLAIQEQGAVARIDRGDLVELSAGYRLMIDPTPGVTPDGQRYDAIQRNRVYNHVALLERGMARAGGEASLRLDGLETDEDLAVARIDEDDSRSRQRAPASARQPEMRMDTMKTERIDGVDYEIGSTAHAQARARFDEAQKARIAELEAKAKDAVDKATAEKARADSLEQKVKGLEAQLTPAAIDKRVADRTALVSKAQPILGPDAKLDGKSEHEIRLAVVQKLDAAFKVDSIEESQRELYVQARFDADTRNVATAGSPQSPLARAKGAVLPPPTPGANQGGAQSHRADGAEPYVPIMQRMSTGFYSGPGLTR